MKPKLAECPRTWHSLWDEMFSALSAAPFEADSEQVAQLGHEAGVAHGMLELEARFIQRSSNDNGRR